MRRGFGSAGVCVALLCALGGDVSAQESRGDVQNFEPTMGPGAIYSVEGADTFDHLKFGAGLGFNYSSAPLLAEDEDGEISRIVDQQLALNLMGGIGLAGMLQLDMMLPVYIVNNATLQDEDLSGGAAGDLTARLKGRLLSSKDGPVGVGLQLSASAPTGRSEAFIGAGGLTVTPEVIVDTRVGPVLLALNVGARIQPEVEISNLTQGSELRYGAGAEVGFWNDLIEIGGELYGRSPFAQAFESQATPLEGLLGVKLNTPTGVSIATGFGGGLLPGFGAPEFRGFVYVTYDSQPREELPAEIDPTLDSDDDGVPDVADTCPKEAEDLDGFQDDDGCPDSDNDNDRVLDADDQCPDEAGEPANGGCPTKDRDGDGVLDDADQCPDEAEDLDDYADDDGCPERDNDDDGILDADDQCPTKAEDIDGFQDEDGCPELDNDADGILDTEDKCPGEAETYNGNEDDDGCPDGKQTVTLLKTEIKITSKIFFASGKATILKKSFGLLDTLATVLARNPQVRLVRIEGHTDDKGDADKNMVLSQARAEAVRSYLVGKGIDADRLEAKGYGETRPTCSDIASLTKSKRLERKNRKKISECREASRRVEFLVVEQDDATRRVIERPSNPALEKAPMKKSPISGGEEVVE